jgi:hypothetical protein
MFIDNYEALQAALDGNTLSIKVENRTFSDLKPYEINCMKCKLNAECDIPSEIEEKRKKYLEIMCAFGDSML